MMGAVTAQLFVSLDGVAQSPERWHFPYVDDAMLRSVEQHLIRAEVLLLGAATYDIFAATWPNRSRDTVMSERINSMPKAVVTSRTKSLEWENSTILERELSTAIPRLAKKASRDIAVVGSISLVRSLLLLGLVDRLQLFIHPVVLGSGRRLFDEETEQTQLKLVSADVFNSGVIDALYAPPITN